MQQFRVTVKVESHEEYFVEAENEEQAKERFEEYLHNSESDFVEEGNHFMETVDLEEPEFSAMDSGE